MNELLQNPPDWLIQKLKLLDAVSAGDPAISLQGDTVYAVLFGGTFGPMVEPLITDVTAPPDRLADTIAALDKQRGDIVWRPFQGNDAAVLDRLSIRMHDGVPQVIFPDDQKMQQLKNGIIAPDDITTDKDAARLSALYPGLKMPSRESPVQVLTSHIQLEMESQKKTILHKKKEPIFFDPTERPWIEDVLDWHRQNPPAMEWVPAPVIGHHSSDDPWNDGDLAFRRWLLEQSMHVYGDREDSLDDTIRKIIQVQGTDQKGTHQGWKTWQHALGTTIRLETDHLPGKLQKPMRLAMLLHDIGKTKDRTVWTAGCHAAYGSKIWTRTDIAVSETDRDLITFIIKNHDVLGTLDKTIKNSGYAAGLSAQDVADRIRENPLGDPYQALDMICAINDADIGSLSTLRYFMGLTPLLSGLVRENLDKPQPGRNLKYAPG